MTIPPILCYHKVDDRFELGFTQLEPRVFRRQVETLASLGYRSLGSAELLHLVASSPRPPVTSSPAVVLTFDDGYSALADHAFPVLADHGLSALVFVVSDYVGRENTWDVQYGWRVFRHLDWDQLGYWQERGIEVHSHTATHARLTWLHEAAAMDELCRSREEIARRLGRAPAGVSYPFGSVNDRVRQMAARAGYSLGFAAPSETGRDALSLPRLPVYGWDRLSIPLVLRDGALGDLGRRLARFTNRCAVGTALFQRWLGRRYVPGGPLGDG